MAHLFTCPLCGRTFRCDANDHAKPSWPWCLRRCPDVWLHGEGSLVTTMDAEVLRMFDEAIEGAER